MRPDGLAQALEAGGRALLPGEKAREDRARGIVERDDEVARPSPAQEPIVCGAVLKHQHARQGRARTLPAMRPAHLGGLQKPAQVKHRFRPGIAIAEALPFQRLVEVLGCEVEIFRPVLFHDPIGYRVRYLVRGRTPPSAYRLSLPLRPPGKRPASGGNAGPTCPKAPPHPRSSTLRHEHAQSHRQSSPSEPPPALHPLQTNPDISSATENGHIECHQQPGAKLLHGPVQPAKVVLLRWFPRPDCRPDCSNPWAPASVAVPYNARSISGTTLRSELIALNRYSAGEKNLAVQQPRPASRGGPRPLRRRFSAPAWRLSWPGSRFRVFFALAGEPPQRLCMSPGLRAQRGCRP